MSIENARAFYQRIAKDEAFRNQLRNAASDDQRRATIRATGYDFTPEEWGIVINELRRLKNRELSEPMLETVTGGVALPINPIVTGAVSGVVFPKELSWPF
ncbi:MAG: Nif11-like leader peptide family natural product precursor [Nostoc sp.]|uniref:Nif11-like leader peptide family natural product precursor n=1 Tax=Nostoc sp. TaxID=1180 RepID=UPI002FFB6110